MSIRATVTLLSLFAAAALQASDPVGGYASGAELPVAAEALRSFGDPSLPAWQAPGFVMEEVVATAYPAALDEPTAPISPHLLQLLELHRNELRELY